MTTIATDGKTVAADTQASIGGERMQRPHVKIERRGNRIYGVSGTAALQPLLIDWYEKGHVLDDLPKVRESLNWTMLVMEPGSVKILGETCPVPDDVSYPFAIGSGAEFALGALFAGASPLEAVKIACLLDVNSGGMITTMPLEEDEMREAAE
jgi:ATP-dependent protease HslVU (ClpYQ) peptidase subunit